MTSYWRNTMGVTSQIADNSSTACSGYQQRNHQSTILLVQCEGNPPTHVTPHKGPVIRKEFPCYDISDERRRLHVYPDSKVHGANMGPTWVLSAPDGPHVGPMNLVIRVTYGADSPPGSKATADRHRRSNTTGSELPAWTRSDPYGCMHIVYIGFNGCWYWVYLFHIPHARSTFNVSLIRWSDNNINVGFITMHGHNTQDTPIRCVNL